MIPSCWQWIGPRVEQALPALAVGRKSRKVLLATHEQATLEAWVTLQVPRRAGPHPSRPGLAVKAGRCSGTLFGLQRASVSGEAGASGRLAHQLQGLPYLHLWPNRAKLAQLYTEVLLQARAIFAKHKASAGPKAVAH